MNTPGHETLLWATLALGLLNALLLLALLLRRPRRPDDVASRGEVQQLLAQNLGTGSEQLVRALRQEMGASARDGRQEVLHTLGTFQQVLTRQTAEATRTQNAQIDAFAQQLALLQKTLADTLATQLQALGEGNARRLAEVRATLETQLAQLQQGNAAKLDEMRRTVDEKLHATLQTRLGESFRQVAERLEQVHKGLGEMHTLAQGVGDLRHLLANVKTRGLFGEAQLAALLEQALAPEQYAAQVPTRPGSRHVVDFAIRLPGRGHGPDEVPVWLPIDAKFPNEDYERLLDAQQRADAPAAAEAARALEARIRQQARSVAAKYLAPPHTTDFAILFLPTEGLYAEVLRRPGLMQDLQRQHHVTLAGPTTLLALLGSLQMGFRTLALEKRSSEVWQVLGAVKTEFGKFGDVLARVKNQTQTVLNTLDAAQTRTNVMNRALKSVQALPERSAAAWLPPEAGDATAAAQD
ncbi:DNA recombination protein RmuC [Comamonadaceae bacterium OH2545_COT-014]|nr:DNA recombination protein RmuC [Comamonadaceae bacterium OH2545_COT-014]